MSEYKQVKVGESRASQLLYTFGVGALMDLPKMSVVVMGLDDWKHREHSRKISEERLLKAVQHELGPQVEKLLAPPNPSPQDTLAMDPITASKIGVPVAPFPRFMRCAACQTMAPISSPLVALKSNFYRAESNRYVHVNCQRSKGQPPMLPVRFLVACERGHLDDFPWRFYVHRGPTSCMGALEMRELGASGEPSALEIRCKECHDKRRMSDAFNNANNEVLPRCRGRRPHLRDFDQDGCGIPVRTILLAASNSWFSDTLTVLSVPVSADPLAQQIEAQWPTVQHFKDAGHVTLMRQLDQLGPLAAFDDDAIFAAIQQRKHGEDAEDDDDDLRDLKLPEWQVLSAPESATLSEDFQLRQIPAPAAYTHLLSQVVLAERLRSVTALLGFTRIASPRDFIDDADVLQARRAPLSRGKPTFIPATEVRGEGIFLTFQEPKIRAWCKDQRTHIREQQFEQAHEQRRAVLGLPAGVGFPGIRYILLHSFSHALMRQFSLSCGYSAASLSERIYAREPDEEGGPMAGILIYTAAPDSEGTLGGLVSLGETAQLGGHIQQALEELRLCASDPLCAEHYPMQDNATLHGAACHACLFAPETSCERSNRFLDRGLLVETMAPMTDAFFRPLPDTQD